MFQLNFPGKKIQDFFSIGKAWLRRGAPLALPIYVEGRLSPVCTVKVTNSHLGKQGLPTI